MISLRIFLGMALIIGTSSLYTESTSLTSDFAPIEVAGYQLTEEETNKIVEIVTTQHYLCMINDVINHKIDEVQQEIAVFKKEVSLPEAVFNSLMNQIEEIGKRGTLSLTDGNITFLSEQEVVKEIKLLITNKAIYAHAQPFEKSLLEIALKQQAIACHRADFNTQNNMLKKAVEEQEEAFIKKGKGVHFLNQAMVAVNSRLAPLMQEIGQEVQKVFSPLSDDSIDKK
jgi:hypothetical protein